MVEHLGWVVAVVAAVRLIKYAIDNKDRFWRLILIVVVLGAIAAGLLWVFDTSHPGLHARTAPSAAAAVAGQMPSRLDSWNGNEQVTADGQAQPGA